MSTVPAHPSTSTLSKAPSHPSTSGVQYHLIPVVQQDSFKTGFSLHNVYKVFNKAEFSRQCYFIDILYLYYVHILEHRLLLCIYPYETSYLSEIVLLTIEVISLCYFSVS